MAKVLTEEDILNATTYIPSAKKIALAHIVAEQSIVKVNVTANEEGEEEKSLPDRWSENYSVRSIAQMMVLIQEYLNQKTEKEDGFTVAEYDEWGESAVFNQLDRFKQSKNAEVRNRVYDLLDDYREFCKFVGSDITMQLSVRNDPITRVTAWLAEQIPPEVIEKLKNGLVNARDSIDNYLADRKKKGLE